MESFNNKNMSLPAYEFKGVTAQENSLKYNENMYKNVKIRKKFPQPLNKTAEIIILGLNS